MRRNEVEK